MTSDLPRVVDVDYVELYVSDLSRACRFYESALGFRMIDTVATGDEENNTVSVFLRRRDVRLRITAPQTPSGAVAEHIRVHGEGVKDIALAVRGVDALFDRSVRLGARAVASPVTLESGDRRERKACIGVFGDVVHTLLDRTPEAEVSPLNNMGSHPEANGAETAIERLDHAALAVEAGALDKWVAFYVDALAFAETHQENVSTEYSAMRSKVVQSVNGSVRFPIMEPATGKRKSQIEAFLEANQGAGAQHLAFQSSDIVQSVSVMAGEGVEFLPTPRTYYEKLEDRVGRLPDLETLASFGILADRDSAGVLLQVFSKPVVVRPTLFLEVVERRGALGFGSGNIRALFEAVERASASSQSA